jgi:hypothetical protein
MMTPELYVFMFAALGAYVTVGVWHRTAEERRIQQLARGEREGGRDGSRDGRAATRSAGMPGR